MSANWTLPPFDDAAAQRFYDELRERRLRYPRCVNCKRTFVPPRTRCSRCFTDALPWIDAPARGVLYAFTQQEVGLRFLKPEVLGIVELAFEDGPARVLSAIDGDFDTLRIGMPVALDFIDVGEGVVLHRFRPVAP